MKKTLTVGLGGRNFIIDEDAYLRLGSCLDSYKAKLKGNVIEVTEEIESRIADLFTERLHGREVVDLKLVEEVTEFVGLPGVEEIAKTEPVTAKVPHRFYRDPEDQKIAGVCSGLANYLDTDVTLVRILFLAGLLLAGWGFWLYIIIWVLAPQARSAAQKCELRGIPCTAENLAKFTTCR